MGSGDGKGKGRGKPMFRVGNRGDFYSSERKTGAATDRQRGSFYSSHPGKGRGAGNAKKEWDVVEVAGARVSGDRAGGRGDIAGDWRCPSCNDYQFARNAVCRRCGTRNPGL